MISWIHSHRIYFLKTIVDFLEYWVSNSFDQKNMQSKKQFSKNSLKYKSPDSFFPEKWLINQTSISIEIPDSLSIWMIPKSCIPDGAASS